MEKLQITVHSIVLIEGSTVKEHEWSGQKANASNLWLWNE